MVDRVQELREQVAPLLEEIRAIEDAQKMAEQKPHIGRFYRTRNSFGGNREDWWLYFAVVGVSDYGWLSGVQFQVDCEGRLEIEKQTRIHIHDDFEEISENDFFAEFDNAIEKGMQMRDSVPRRQQT